MAQRTADAEEYIVRDIASDYLSKLRRRLAKMEPEDRKLILYLTQKMARR